jgi:hypothetical protein
MDWYVIGLIAAACVVVAIVVNLIVADGDTQ